MNALKNRLFAAVVMGWVKVLQFRREPVATPVVGNDDGRNYLNHSS